MEPRRDDGDDTAVQSSEDGLAEVPQWSPVVTTGTTPCDSGRSHAARGAAMEPRRDDGDDGAVRGVKTSRSVSPQGSPVVTTGTTGRPGQSTMWEPCRNGAPP